MTDRKAIEAAVYQYGHSRASDGARLLNSSSDMSMELCTALLTLIEGVCKELEQAQDLLRGAQTHLLDGDNSIWRLQVDEFVRRADRLAATDEVPHG